MHQSYDALVILYLYVERKLMDNVGAKTSYAKLPTVVYIYRRKFRDNDIWSLSG